MPWENKGGSPKGPWGQGGNSGNDNRGGLGGGNQGGGNIPPEFERFFKQGQEQIKNFLPGGSGSLGSGGIALVVLLAFLGWLATGFFTVKPDEVAVKMRFGKFAGVTQPGWDWNPPGPLGMVKKVNIGLNRTAIGVGTQRATQGMNERLMLTGDENIIDIAFEVQWRVNPAKADDYVFNVKNPDSNVRSVAESAMREVVGRRKIQNILTNEQAVVAQETQQIIQHTLDNFGTGVTIQNVQFLEILPPQPVREAFFDVNAAQQDLTRLQNEARTIANKIVPEARGEAEKIIQDAEAYKSRVVNEAQGQASRFKQVLDEYRKAPLVTRERLYIETMEQVLGGSDKIIMDSSQGQNIVPYLPLDQMRRSQPKDGAK